MTRSDEIRILAGVKLPPYSVRVSARARRVRLVIKPGEGLTVVAPAGFDLDRVEPLLIQRLDWIEKHLDPAWKTPGLAAPAGPPEPPAEMRLRAVSRLVRVRYRADARAGVRVVSLTTGAQPWPDRFPQGSASRTPGENPGAPCGPDPARGQDADPAETLEVRGDIADRAAVAESLRTWLLRQARSELAPWLDRRAGELGLGYSGMGVRLQRTRWGSCSAKGVINLNAALLFLPRPLTAYVIDHELAHTRHLNHSPAYWSLLETLHPGSRQADKAMRDARVHVPAWVKRD